jgi:hypothetical protein
MANQRTGKIARASFEVRTQVNELMRDGATAAAISAYLASQGITDVNEQNVTNWRQGGHQDWLKEQARLAEMAAKREFALEIVKANEGSKLHEATLHIAASQLYDVLEDFDLGNLKQLLAEKPENYANIVNSLAKLSKGALDVEKFKEHVRARKEAIERELGVAKTSGGISPETIERIERELKLL